jgi:hypothetical protein
MLKIPALIKAPSLLVELHVVARGRWAERASHEARDG